MILHSYKWGFWLRASSGRGVSISIDRNPPINKNVYRLGPIALQFFGVYK